LKLVRFLNNGVPLSGFIEGNSIIESNDDGKRKTSRTYNLDNTQLLAPCTPSKIIAVGLNYKAHAAEFSKALPEEPMLFMKPPTALIGTGAPIIYPSEMTRRVDYEGELAIVIGKTARNIDSKSAPDFILGYTCFNDVTARDLQKKDIQFTRAKGFDTFAPTGPCIETDLDPTDIRITTYLNGDKKQDTSTKDMIFNCYELLSFISRVMTLLPGDIIATGTPSGVGPVKVGDTIEVKIDSIGSLINTIV